MEAGTLRGAEENSVLRLSTAWGTFLKLPNYEVRFVHHVWMNGRVVAPLGMTRLVGTVQIEVRAVWIAAKLGLAALMPAAAVPRAVVT